LAHRELGFDALTPEQDVDHPKWGNHLGVALPGVGLRFAQERAEQLFVVGHPVPPGPAKLVRGRDPGVTAVSRGRADEPQRSAEGFFAMPRTAGQRAYESDVDAETFERPQAKTRRARVACSGLDSGSG
jgi:hypothetical protein